MPEKRRVKCPHCGADSIIRTPRKTFLERTVLWRFGFYPWYCGVCRKHTSLRSRGSKLKRRKSDLNPIA